MLALGGRKFLLSLLALGIITAALWWGKLSSSDFLWALMGLLGIHGASNVATKQAGKKTE